MTRRSSARARPERCRHARVHARANESLAALVPAGEERDAHRAHRRRSMFRVNARAHLRIVVVIVVKHKAAAHARLCLLVIVKRPFGSPTRTQDADDRDRCFI